VQPELLVDLRASRAVAVQRLHLAARAVQGQHQVCPPRLAQGVLGHERLELAHQRGMAPELQLGLDALLHHGQAQLLQPLDVQARRRLELEVSQRRATPQRLSLAQ
jgi:hypothetical protein